MEGLYKYDALYAINVSTIIWHQLNLPDAFSFVFKNDVSCFGLGESF